MKKTLFLPFILIGFNLNAQDTTKTPAVKASDIPVVKAEAAPLKVDEKKVHWYDKINIRGYMQVRYNRLGESNP